MNIVALAGNDIEQNRVADYKGSKLYLYDNGTFTVTVMYKTSNIFLGIGMYKIDSNKNYVFTYTDMWRIYATKLQQDTDNYHRTFTYAQDKNGRIELVDPNNRIYYFK